MVDDNYTITGVTTKSEANSFIMATFNSATYVNEVYISHCSNSHPGSFGIGYTNCLKF